MKTKKNPDAIAVIFPVVARPYLCYVSESKGFGFCQITSFLVTVTAATAAAAAEEFLTGVQAPIPSHPGIKYPVRAPPLTPIIIPA